MKYWDIPSSIPELEFDGDKTDLRLHHEGLISWYEDEEGEYVKMEKRIHDFEIRRNAYTIYTWCDISGYDYWVNKMRESNYIQISVAFTKEDFNNDYLELLKVDIKKAYEKFEEYHTSKNF